ncbi:MAG: hypothetical protein JXC31_04285 [Acholeplasmataceae bacterium]|nr:hypothetical protein [Acholeplasmataceae bacterium]
MKNVIERYVYDVMRRLPENERDEVRKELVANIDDMLGEDRSDENIEKVLLELGEPRLLATRYQTKERYLISPAYFDDYIRVLKIVMIVFIVVSLVFGTIDLLINLDVSSLWEVIGSILSRLIGDVFTALLSAFAWVTVIFWAIEKANLSTKREEWNLKKLPEIPKNNSPKINRTGAIVGLVIESIFSAIFIILLIRYIDYIGIYENTTMVAPLFTKEIIEAFIPIFIVSISISIIVSAYKAYHPIWDIKLSSIYTFSKILTLVITLVFINYPNLFNILMFDKIAEYLSLTTSKVIDGFDKGIRIFSIFLGVMTGIDLIATWIKTLKGQKAISKIIE